MSYTGYDIIGNQRYGYGTGHYVRPDLLERGNFIYQESDSGYGTHPFIYRGDRVIRDTVADDNAKTNPLASMFDGIGMGFGFTIALTLLGAVREFLGTGKIFNLTILPEEYGMLIFVLAPGAFIALGYLIAIINSLKKA